MEALAQSLRAAGWTLRSGGAEGADTAFENGARRANGPCDPCEIYLPWPNFQGRSGPDCYLLTPEAVALAATLQHPRWNFLSQGARKLLSRNMHQICGKDLQSTCDFVICYTKNGSGSGGTGFALKLAKQKNVPIFDYGTYYLLEDAVLELQNFLAPHHLTAPPVDSKQRTLDI
jgi:hypothetical protein